MSNFFFRGGKSQTLQQVVRLGTGAVSTTTPIVCVAPFPFRIKAVRYYGQAAVTGTTITAELHVRASDGGAGVSTQSAATDVKFASAGAAKIGVAAALETANLKVAGGRLLEVVVTATSITAGPGDLLVSVEIEPVAK